MEFSTRDVVLTGLCAGLYAFLGYMSYLGVFAFGVGVVRFWPVVFIPAVFSIVFSPLVGGLGAAIGIFISDMLVHGNALLSLSVGVPANFFGFYLIGYIARRIKFSSSILLVIIILLQFTPLLLTVALAYTGYIGYDVAEIYVAVTIVSIVATLVVIAKAIAPYSHLLAYTVGLMTGSAIIGVGLWLYSQFLTLPSGVEKAPVAYALVWFIWTYYTEIPFLVTIAPAIVKAIEKKMGRR